MSDIALRCRWNTTSGWMAPHVLHAGQAQRRVVRLPDGAILNRYWDDRAEPRDESWREDIVTAQRLAATAATRCIATCALRPKAAGISARAGWPTEAR